MKDKFLKWWHATTLNEKLMYSLVLMLLIGIATRWRYVLREVGDAFAALVGL
ncbi:MAG: hypothetical protein RR931_05555 [Mucinivorans sp.]